MMELREAIEEVRNEPDFNYGLPLTQAIETILNAVADGTLIPADAVFQVRDGYIVEASVDGLSGGYGVELTQALEIRSADDVRREVLQQAANEVEAATEAARQRFNAQGGDYDNGYGNAGLDLSEGIRALIDTPQHKGGDDELEAD